MKVWMGTLFLVFSVGCGATTVQTRGGRVFTGVHSEESDQILVDTPKGSDWLAAEEVCDVTHTQPIFAAAGAAGIIASIIGFATTPPPAPNPCPDCLGIYIDSKRFERQIGLAAALVTSVAVAAVNTYLYFDAVGPQSLDYISGCPDNLIETNSETEQDDFEQPAASAGPPNKDVVARLQAGGLLKSRTDQAWKWTRSRYSNDALADRTQGSRPMPYSLEYQHGL